MNNYYNNGMNPALDPRSRTSYYSSPVSNANTNNIIWVQGIEGAKAWQLSPNSMVILLDSEIEGTMYIKVSDNIGMSSLRIFKYVEEVPSTSATKVTINNDLDLSEYVRKDELSNLIKEVINEQSVSTTSKSTASSANTATAAKPKVILQNSSKS